MLSLTRRPGQGFRLYYDGELVGWLGVRYGQRDGEIKVLFDCSRRLQVQREELPPRDAVPPPHDPVREESDGPLDADDSEGGTP